MEEGQWEGSREMGLGPSISVVGKQVEGMKNLVLYRSEVYTGPCLYRSRSQETGWGEVGLHIWEVFSKKGIENGLE